MDNKINVDLVIDNLTKQIAILVREKAVLNALAVQREVENEQLRKELEQYKKNKKSPAEK